MSDGRSFNDQVIEEFRANGGKVGGPFEGIPLLLLTTTGAKTGRQLTSPLAYVWDGDRIIVIASNGGSDKHPNWYHNVRANPIVTVDLGDETFEAKAAVTTGEERDRLFDAMATLMPGFRDYERKTSRLIPVIAVERVS